MDEELMDLVTEETIEVTGAEIIKTEVTIEDEEYDVSTEEVIKTVEVTPAETIEIEMDEAIGWVGGNSERHYSLQGRNDPDQHEIEAITNLRAELDEIERLKTVYSDEKGVADYYEWEDKNPLAENRIGYFVSLCKDVRTIKRCTGEDIFGITVDNSAFVGGQDNIARDYKYGLVACSGVAKVRCELDVQVGDYVVSNDDGVAQKTDSGYGCKVIAIHEITEPEEISLHGVRHAVVSLDLSINQIDKMAKEADKLAERVSVNEVNIVSAINVANQAYQSSSETKEFTQNQIDDIADKVIEAIGKSDSALELSKGAENSASQAQLIAVQAQSLANSAALSAQDMKDEAVKTANDAWKGINDLTETLKPITEWEDPDNSENTGAQFFTEYMVDGLKTKVDIETFETKTEEGFSAIQRNVREVRSLIVDIDKYSVGEYSQANGLTLEQAQSILEVGMIYVPTSHENLDAHPEYHKEEYVYEVNGETKTYVRWFTPGYLYRWDKIPNKEIGVGWLTIGNNTETNNPEVATREENYSASQITPNVSPWVFFSYREPKINNIWNYGYWFTNGDSIVDVDGNPSTYEPYTLYKWEKSEDEDGYWFAVATLAGNSSNRATSQVRQTVNNIALEVANAREGYAGLDARLSDTDASVTSLAAWKNGDGAAGEAIIRQDSKNGESSIVISTLQRNANDEVKASASLVLNAVQKEDGTGSFLAMDADNINFTASADYSVLAENIRMNANQINFTAGDLGGRNLLRDTSKPLTLEAGNEAINCRATFVPTESLIKDQTYSFGADVKVENTKALNQISIGILPSEYPTDMNYITTTFDIENGHISGQITPTMDNPGNFTIYAGVHNSTNGNKVTFSNMKLEKGVVATDWTPALEDQVSAEQTGGEMNWKMTPNECVWWNEKTNATNNPLMKLDKGGLKIQGEVISDKGNIGGWDILSYSIEKPVTIIENGKEATYKAYMQAPLSQDLEENLNRSAFAVSKTVDGVTTWPFFVTYAGKMTSTLGNIGGWTLDGNMLSKGKSGMHAGPEIGTSLDLDNYTSPIRFFSGGTLRTNVTCSDTIMLTYYDDDVNTTYLKAPTKFGRITSIQSVDVTPNGDLPGSNDKASPYFYNYKYWIDEDGVARVQMTDGYNGGQYLVSITCLYNVFDEPKFVVLEDGSLYASNASIYGSVYADKGDFNGVIHAKDGDIGGLIISKEGISSGDGGLTFDKSGLVIAQQLEVNDYFKANEFKVGKISGRGDNSAFLDFESSGTVSQEVEVSLSNISITKGEDGYFGKYTEGEVRVAVTASPAVYNTKVFKVTAHYKANIGTYSASRTAYTTIATGGTSATVSFPDLVVVNNRYGDDYYCHYQYSSVSPNLYTEETPNTANAIAVGGALVPDGTRQLGTSDKRWKEIWCTQSSINSSSDRNEKNSIEVIPDKYEAFFDELQPVRYKFNVNDSNRYHMGFISQDVRDALCKADISTFDFAGYVEYDKEDGTKGYGLRYGEFIALCVNETQKLKKRVAELEQKLAEFTTPQND